MAPRLAQMDAARALDFPLYVIKLTLCVLVGGLEVVVVGVLHVDASAQMNYVKYRRKRVEGLFLNIMEEKKRPLNKFIRERGVTSLLLIWPVSYWISSIHSTHLFNRSPAIYLKLGTVEKSLFDFFHSRSWARSTTCGRPRSTSPATSAASTPLSSSWQGLRNSCRSDKSWDEAHSISTAQPFCFPRNKRKISKCCYSRFCCFFVRKRLFLWSRWYFPAGINHDKNPLITTGLRFIPLTN